MIKYSMYRLLHNVVHTQTILKWHFGLCEWSMSWTFLHDGPKGTCWLVAKGDLSNNSEIINMAGTVGGSWNTHPKSYAEPIFYRHLVHGDMRLDAVLLQNLFLAYETKHIIPSGHLCSATSQTFGEKRSSNLFIQNIHPIYWLAMNISIHDRPGSRGWNMLEPTIFTHGLPALTMPPSGSPGCSLPSSWTASRPSCAGEKLVHRTCWSIQVYPEFGCFSSQCWFVCRLSQTPS